MGEPIRVLHVDDDPDVADLTATYLEREDDQFDIVTATSMSDGCDVLADTDIDCIVSDYDMPAENGLAFLRSVRETHPNLPFILYTGKGSEEVASEAISAGVTDYLQKGTGTSQYTVLANRIRNAVEQYRAEQSVEATEEKLRHLAEKTDDILFMFGAEWDQLHFINSAYEEIWGGSIPELEANPRTFLDHVHPDDRDIVQQSMERLAEGSPDEVEYRVEADDGDQRWVRAESKPIFDDDGSVSRIVGYVRDITEQKERQQELERLWDRVEFILETTDSAIWEWDLTADTYERHGLHRLFGLSEPDRETDSLTDSNEPNEIEQFLAQIHPDDRPEVEESLSQLPSETESHRIEFRVLPDGGIDANDESVRWLEDRAHIRPDSDNPSEVVGLTTDITARKQRERAIESLHQTAQDLWTAGTPEAVAETVVEAARDILEMPANVVHLYDDDSDCLEPVAATDQATDLVGEIPSFERGDGLAWEVYETGEPQMHDDVSTAPGRLNENTPVRSELIMPLNDHGVFMVGCADAAAFDETDISLMRTLAAHATTALDHIERERRLRALQDRTQDLMHTPSNERTAQVAVEAAHDILGSPSAGVHLQSSDGDRLQPVAVMDTIRDEFDPPTYDRTAEDDLISDLVWDAYESEETVVLDDTRTRGQLASESAVRSAIIHPLGDHGVLLVTAAQAYAFNDTDKTFIEIIATALTAALDRVQRETDLQEREQELHRQNDRLEEFASVVSHDLRNPLNVAQGRVELAREEDDSEDLAAAASALERSQRLIDDVLTLARQGEAVGEVESVRLQSVIEDCWRTVETEDATLHVEAEQAIRADRSRLQQLIENLLRNAIDHGGPDVAVTIGDLDEGFYVADDGEGIPEDEHDDVFDPGYSTADDGTGFGLNIVQEIAAAHDWTVDVTDSEAGGARFEIIGVESE